jgi:hypothetical protein
MHHISEVQTLIDFVTRKPLSNQKNNRNFSMEILFINH